MASRSPRLGTYVVVAASGGEKVRAFVPPPLPPNPPVDIQPFLSLLEQVNQSLTGKQRRRLFVYDQYLDILNQGTER